MDRKVILKAIKGALQEDLGLEGDITSIATTAKEKVNFTINAREKMIVCGIPIIQELFCMYQDDIHYTIHQEDGVAIDTGTTIISGQALARTLFSIERVALNFLQHLSGIASITNNFVEIIKHTNVIIRDTRKTTPGMRLLEKYAVLIGKGDSYRYSLSDEILIKDNHIAACGGTTIAIDRVKRHFQNKYIAIECDNLQQVQAALIANVDLILLDNMTIADIKTAVGMAAGRKTKLEASGGVTLKNVQTIAETGVHYISIGMITHSAPNKDIGLDIEQYS